MSISASDIKFYKAANNNDTVGNGGIIGTTEIVDNTLNNLFPNVSPDDRIAGKTRYRKEFLRNENTEDLTFENVEIWIGSKSTGDDYFQLKDGTDTDTQAEADDYTNWAGAGTLHSPVGSGETSLEVDYDTNSGVFSGEATTVHVDDGTNEADVDVVGTPSWLSNTATFNISGELGYNFSADTTIVSTVVDLGDIETSSDSWVETSSAGTYDESTYPLVLYNVGTVTDSWTLTFSDSTNFSVSGANTGSVGSGDINTDFQPSNGSSYYHKIDKDGFGGSWANGDTITFNTVHAGKGLWAKEVVPSGIASKSNNTIRLDGNGESA